MMEITQSRAGKTDRFFVKPFKWNSNSKSFALTLNASVKLVIEGINSSECESDKRETILKRSTEDEASILRAAYTVSNMTRRLLTRLINLRGNIRAFCRVKPLEEGEADESLSLVKLSRNEIQVTCLAEEKLFKFDHVYGPASSQEEVFAELEPVIDWAVEGHNVCILAYGQTGTGKTYTMEGTKSSPGVVPRTLRHLFRECCHNTHIKYTFALSMLEIYKASLRDLLVCKPTRPAEPHKSLSIQLGVSDHVEIENLTEVIAQDFSEAIKLYRKGTRSRTTSLTTSNDTSSRSHCLVRIRITQQNARTGDTSSAKIWLIDLGGSERLFKSKAWGKTLEEGKAINVSLSALADVISALNKKQMHIPYRNSKLTQVIRDCFGGESRALFLAHISLKEKDLGETICSLGFASRASSSNLQIEDYQDKEINEHDIAQMLQGSEEECQALSVEIQKLMNGGGKMHVEVAALAADPKKLESVRVAKEAICDRISHDPDTLPRFMAPTVSSRSKVKQCTDASEPVSSPCCAEKKNRLKLADSNWTNMHPPHHLDEKLDLKENAYNTQQASLSLPKRHSFPAQFKHHDQKEIATPVSDSLKENLMVNSKHHNFDKSCGSFNLDCKRKAQRRLSLNSNFLS